MESVSCVQSSTFSEDEGKRELRFLEPLKPDAFSWHRVGTRGQTGRGKTSDTSWGRDRPCRRATDQDSDGYWQKMDWDLNPFVLKRAMKCFSVSKCSSVLSLKPGTKRLRDNSQKLVPDRTGLRTDELNEFWFVGVSATLTLRQVTPELQTYSLNFYIFSLHVVLLGIPLGDNQLNPTNPKYFNRIVV